MDNSLCAVINPFGESYPEKPSVPNILPAYKLIRDYIFSGGIFITCGGLPFTYYFDVTSGQEKELTTVIRNYPVSLRVTTQQGRPTIQVLGTTLLINHLIQRDFNMMTIMDDPSSGRIGPIPLQTYQKIQDKRFWNCGLTGSTLHIFRPIDPSVSPDAIPIVRTQIHGKEVFPVAFVKYGFGLFLHIWMNLSKGRKFEYKFTKEAVKGVLQNYSSYF